MCTRKELDRVYKALVDLGEDKVIATSTIVTDRITFEVYKDAVDRLVVMGFANKTKLLTGETIAKITPRGEHMYNALH